jgi:hypothetical protein
MKLLKSRKDLIYCVSLTICATGFSVFYYGTQDSV